MKDAERYTLGYGPASIAMMSTRTAENHASFFLDLLFPNMRVLDVGCGPGTITIGIAEAVYPGTVVGLEQELTQTEAIASGLGQHQANLFFESGDVYNLRYDEGEFDAVFASALIGNLQRPIDALEELRRVLKPGGVIGIKEFDHSANIVYPQPEFQKEVNTLYNKLRIYNGHDPDSGRKVKGYLSVAGFDQVNTVATYQTIPTAPGKGSPLMEAMVRDEWGPAFVDLGWVNASQVQAWIEQSKNYETGDDAFVATAWIEASARRPLIGRDA